MIDWLEAWGHLPIEGTHYNTVDVTASAGGDEANAGLGECVDGELSEETTASDGESGGTATADGGAVSGEAVEFTGTVVQTGNPVILDDGSETRTVETDERVQLGQEVTVRGTATDEDRIVADDVF